MRTIEGENDLLLTCAETPDGIAILRCETRDDVVRLPDEIGGVPVTALGSYALSERAPDLTGRDTFRVRVTCGGPEPMHDANAIRAVAAKVSAQRGRACVLQLPPPETADAHRHGARFRR